LSLFVAGLLTLILPVLSKTIVNEAANFWVSVFLMMLIGIAMALALAGSLSYMSLMPERFMALNSMGIGFSGFISLVLNTLLLVIFGSDDE